MKNKKKKAERVGGSRLAQLFFTFLKIGAFTFGGGYAMIPLVQRETVENHRWITDDELLDIIAIAESTPGPIAVNSATFVGYRVGGVLSACLATLGLVLPSLIIITLIALVLRNFADIAAVQHAFAGIRVAVCVLVLFSVAKLFRSGVKNALDLVIFAAACLVTIVFGVSPVILVAAAIALGIVLGLVRKGGEAA